MVSLITKVLSCWQYGGKVILSLDPVHVLPNCTILISGFANATLNSSSWQNTLNLIGAAVLSAQVPSEIYSAIGRTVLNFTRVWHLMANALESHVKKAVTKKKKKWVQIQWIQRTFERTEDKQWF